MTERATSVHCDSTHLIDIGSGTRYPVQSDLLGEDTSLSDSSREGRRTTKKKRKRWVINKKDGNAILYIESFESKLDSNDFSRMKI